MNRLANFSKELKKFNAKKIQAETLTVTKHAPTKENRLATKTIRFQAGRKPKNWKVQDLALTTATGEMLDFPEINDPSYLEVGLSVRLENGKPVVDGTYIMPDGLQIEIKDGKITKITEPEDYNPS